MKKHGFHCFLYISCEYREADAGPLQHLTWTLLRMVSALRNSLAIQI